MHVAGAANAVKCTAFVFVWALTMAEAENEEVTHHLATRARKRKSESTNTNTSTRSITRTVMNIHTQSKFTRKTEHLCTLPRLVHTDHKFLDNPTLELSPL